MNNDTNPAKQYIPANFTTHRSAWRKAIELAIANAKSGSVDEDEKAYWEHELAAFDRAFSRLLDNPEPVREALDTKDGESTTVRFCEDVLADIANRLGVTVGDELPTTAALILEALDKQGAPGEAKLAQMRAAFHVNMLRAFPDLTHEQIAAEIARVVGAQASESMNDRPTWADVQAREKDIRGLQSTVTELRQALEVKAGAQSVVPLSAELMRALGDARELAMHNTAAARIPECGDFGNIAQNLDWAVEEIKRTATGPVPSAVPAVSDPAPAN